MTKIYIATQRIFTPPSDDGYIPIQTGKSNTDLDLGYLCDNTGKNISTLNPAVCELSALYWMVENHKGNDDAIGLAHYRRYFAPREKRTHVGSYEVAASNDFEEIGRHLDMIVGEPIGFLADGRTFSVEQNFFGTSIGVDLFLAEEAIRTLSPEYMDAYQFYMRNCQLIPYNMFVARFEVVKAYAEWIFPIILMLVKQVPYETYGDYHKRNVGFIAERLFGVWIVKNRARFKIGFRSVVFCATN